MALIVRDSYGYSEPAIGVKVNESMSVRTTYSDEPLGQVEVMRDFLPSPEELAF